MLRRLTNRKMGWGMSKLFTRLAAVLFLLAGAVHAYRVYSGFSLVVHGHAIPVWGSWIGVAVALLFGVMLIVESRR
jgi:hypothetical protein